MYVSETAIDTEKGTEAFRAFLQRAEVRLSTMHRIASAFISGAGLLLLLPLFRRDSLSAIVRVSWSELSLLRSAGGGWELYTFSLLFVLSAFVVLFVPIYSMYLLLKDVILSISPQTFPSRRSRRH